jgi:hypothetical protein
VQYLDSEGNWQNAGDPVDVPPDTSAAPVIAGWIILSEIEVYAKAPAA